MTSAEPSARVSDIEGTIDRVSAYKADSGWSLVRLFVDGEKVSIRCHLLESPHEGMFIRATGRYEMHPKYGKQFNATEATLEPPDDIFQRAEYIRSLVPFITLTDSKVAAKFKGDLAVDLVPGIVEEAATALRDAWSTKSLDPKSIEFLRDNGLTQSESILVARFARSCNTTSEQIAATNPYFFMEPGISFKKCDELSLRVGMPRNAPERILAGLGVSAREWASEGHTIARRTQLVNACAKMLGISTFEVHDCIDVAVEQGTLDIRHEFGEPHYQLPALRHAEESLAYDVARLSRPLVQKNVPTDEKIVEACGFMPDPEQILAVKMPFQHGLSILTGGPGTGKTSISKAICELWPGPVFIVAPTGMAAKRIAEVVGRPASTAHRFLGYAGEGEVWSFAHNRDNPVHGLADGLLIVEEVSMADVELASALLQVVVPKAAVLLLGDVDQLPSVGPGNVLSDLIAHGVPLTRLLTIHRTATESPIPYFVKAIRDGEMPEFGGSRALRHFEPTRVDENMEVYRIVKGMIAAGVKRSELRVLTPMRQGPYGQYALNFYLQKLWNPNGMTQQGIDGAYCDDATADQHREVLTPKRETIYPGDLVMQTRNDHINGVYNGDILDVLQVGKLGKAPFLRMRSSDGFEYTYKGEKAIIGFRLAYATTIHKAQGSQSKHVILVMVDSHRRMHERRLFYTGASRAQETLTIVGTETAMRMAVERLGDTRVGEGDRQIANQQYDGPRQTGLRPMLTAAREQFNAVLVNEHASAA